LHNFAQEFGGENITLLEQASARVFVSVECENARLQVEPPFRRHHVVGYNTDDEHELKVQDLEVWTIYRSL
jgi:hypothetical protein